VHAAIRARTWQADPVSGAALDTSVTPDVEGLVADWLTLPDVGEALGLDAVRARQLVRDRVIVAVRRGERNVLSVPAEFVQGAAILKGLTGTLTVLADSGFDPNESIRWLYTPDDSLPGTPVAALVANRGTEVKRRAQASGF
jgi:hypothetical protein